MNSQLIDADEQLATVFSHFYCVQLEAQDPPTLQQLLPNYEMLLVFNFGSEVPIRIGDEQHVIRQTAVLGPLQKVLAYELQPGANLIVVNFTLNGFYRLLRVPMHQLKGEGLHNPDVLLNKSCFSDLWAQLVSMRNLADRLQLIREYTLNYAAPVDESTRSLLDSIPYFTNAALEPVNVLAGKHQVSTRNIQLRFRTQLGYSAKELVRFLRFKKVLAVLCQQPFDAVDWLSLVTQYGYYDHSHLIKDFQHYMDISPRQFISQLRQDGMCMSKPGRFY
ncbi:DUF6597 domain-containing transcriptional factor [Spirosoma fluminis]